MQASSIVILRIPIWSIEDVGEADNDGSLHSEVSLAGPADTGVVQRTKRTRLSNCLI